MSFASVFSILGWSLAIVGAAMAAPAAVGFALGEVDSGLAFLLSAGLTVFAGVALFIASRGPRPHTARHESFLAVVLVAIIVPIFAAAPLTLSGAADGFLDAYFEAVSGLTTTGATVLSGLDSVDRSILFWRALLQWMGGIGTVMLVIVHFAHLGVGGMQLYPSPLVHGEQDPLAKRFRDSGISLVSVYAGLTLACIVALWLTELSIFDASVFGLATLSTGGFAPADGSVGALSNRAAEAVLMVFMILGAANLALHWLAVRGRGVAVYWRDPEFPVFLAVVLAGAVFLAAALMAAGSVGALDAVWLGLFHAVSALSTTGFVTGQGTQWPIFVPVLLVVLMLIGGSTGSTSGGIKIMRGVLLARLARREFERLAHPHGVVPINYGGAAVGVDADALRGVWAVFIAFVFTFGAVTVGLALTGLDFREASFAAASALSNTAPMHGAMVDGITVFGEMGQGAKGILAAGMILGRLEFLTMMVLFSPLFWRR